MSMLKKADFYYGALLSAMINNGLVPALIEQCEKRSRYKLTTNKGDYEIYSKYVANPTKRKNEDKRLWQFNFTNDELEEIRRYNNESYCYFALICADLQYSNCEVVLLTLNEAKECLDVDCTYARDSYRITVKYEKSSHGLKVYGTGKADILDGKDNTYKIPRDRIVNL